MISSKRPVIMDATSTMSSNGTIERNDRPERMYNSMSDSRDEITERELLEDPNQDPDDEDTLSDDSLRLRVSDDEADTSQSGLTFDLATPCCSSKQTTSQDSAKGLTESDKKKPSLTETSHSIHESCESGSNAEYQSPKDHNQTLNETCNDSEKKMNRMWRDKGRRERPIDPIHSPNQVLTSAAGYSFYAQYNFGSSNSRKHPSYFNNQDNFGKPPSHRKHGSYWKYVKGKRVHGSKRKLTVGIDKEKTLSSVPLSRSKSQIKTEADSDQSSHAPSNTTSEKTEDLPNVNNESSKECSTVNYNQKSTHGPKTLADFCAEINDRKDIENVSSSNCDFKSVSNDSADVKSIDSMEQCTEASSSVSNQDPSNSRAMSLTPLPDDTEPTNSFSQKTETAIDNVPLSPNSSVDSPDAKKETTESDVGINLNVAEPTSDDTDENALHLTEREVDVNNHIAEPSKELNKVIDSSDISNDLGSDLKSCDSKAEEENLEEKSMSNHEPSIVNEDLEMKRPLNNDNEDKHLDDKDDGKNEANVDEKQTNNLLLNSQEVNDEALGIVVNDEESGDNEGVTTDNKRKLSLHNEETELIERLLQKSKILKNAEEISRNNLVCSETSVKSSDNSRHDVTKKKSSSKPDGVVESQQQNVMKRSLSDIESATDQTIHKKMRITPDPGPKVCSEQLQSLTSTDSTTDEKKTMSAEKSNDTSKPLRYVRKFFQRNMKGKLTKLKREELEELIIQKLVETITMRSEIGRLREQARISERNQEATRIRCQQLSKQIKDFDMVLNRNAVDRRSNNDKPVPPIKINRSVGLQVNFMTDPAMQSLRTLTTNNVVKTNVPNPVTVNGGNTSAISDNTGKITATPRRGIKVRSPRRAEVAKNSSLLTPPLTSTATPTALVVTKPVDTFQNFPTPINSKEQGLSNVNTVQPAAAKVQPIAVNGKTSNQVNRHTSVPNNHIADSNDLIDLTEEEDKNKSINHTTTGILPMVGTTMTSSIATKVPHSRFQRVVQGTLPGNVAITTQPGNIRVVQPVGQPTPTALVNNINTARLAYVLQGPTGAGRQLLISAANPHQVRPATSTVRSQFSNMTYKPGISTLANGTVRVLTTTAPPASNSHIPAPLPKTPHYQLKNGWKLPPPPPSVKISKVGQDIVLSWNMAPLAEHAEIASYQLYAYQEVPGAAPNPNLWKKVGDVRALPLPMACTLKEFTPGNNYHFAVRAVDVHSRMGHYSIPRNISL